MILVIPLAWHGHTQRGEQKMRETRSIKAVYVCLGSKQLIFFPVAEVEECYPFRAILG
jgi:hypothetical protein